jgi:hypothetical protein
VGNAVKLQIDKFFTHLATIVTQGIVYVHKNSPLPTLRKIIFLASTISSRMLLIKYSWVNPVPDCSASTVIRFTLLKKIVNIIFWALSRLFSWNYFISIGYEHMIREI